MRFHAHPKPRRVELFVQTISFRDTSPPVPRIANEVERERLRAAQEQFERQVRWNRRSTAIGLVLGASAVVVAVFTASPWVRWPLLAAAVLELGFVPWHAGMACHRLRRLIATVALDLKSGIVSEGDGKVHSLFGFGRVIQDARTGRLRRLPSEVAGLAQLPSGTEVTYRFALRSGLVLKVETPAGAECGNTGEKRWEHEVQHCTTAEHGRDRAS